MSWPLRFCAEPTTGAARRIGDWWYCPWYIEDVTTKEQLVEWRMGRQYREHVWPKRAPIMVVTPAGEWCIDQRSKGGDGWTVSGEPDRITASPSILIAEFTDSTGKVWPGYHGWLRDGVLTDDTDGRIYPGP